MTKLNDCIFCKIASGEIPAGKIYEDEDVFAFLDISGDVYGHTLVVPKKHYENALVCPPELLSKVVLATQKIANHYTKNCGVDGVNIVANCGEAAEQTVMHLHFHIIPRIKEQPPHSLFADLPKNNFDFEKMQKQFKIN